MKFQNWLLPSSKVVGAPTLDPRKVDEVDDHVGRVEIGRDLDGELAVFRGGVGDVGEDDLIGTSVGTEFGRVDDENARSGDGQCADDAHGFEIGGRGGAVVCDGDLVVVVRDVVVEIRQVEGEGVEVGRLVVDDAIVVAALGDAGIVGFRWSRSG